MMVLEITKNYEVNNSKGINLGLTLDILICHYFSLESLKLVLFNFILLLKIILLLRIVIEYSIHNDFIP